MPSFMIHIVVADKYRKGDLPFYVGSLAPDSIVDRELKDKTHLRCSENRMEDLKALARKLDLNDSFSLGVVLHLFTDYYWDNIYIKSYKDNYVGDNWFLDYRHEISIMSDFFYLHTDLGDPLWTKLELTDFDVPSVLSWMNKDEIKNMIVQGHIRREEAYDELSEVFPPDLINSFSDMVVNKFKEWIKEL